MHAVLFLPFCSAIQQNHDFRIDSSQIIVTNKSNYSDLKRGTVIEVRGTIFFQNFLLLADNKHGRINRKLFPRDCFGIIVTLSSLQLKYRFASSCCKIGKEKPVFQNGMQPPRKIRNGLKWKPILTGSSHLERVVILILQRYNIHCSLLPILVSRLIEHALCLWDSIEISSLFTEDTPGSISFLLRMSQTMSYFSWKQFISSLSSSISILAMLLRFVVLIFRCFIKFATTNCPFLFFCEKLDIVFHFNKVYAILDEYILAGEVQETSKKVILERMKELERLE